MNKSIEIYKINASYEKIASAKSRRYNKIANLKWADVRDYKWLYDKFKSRQNHFWEIPQDLSTLEQKNKGSLNLDEYMQLMGWFPVCSVLRYRVNLMESNTNISSYMVEDYSNGYAKIT